MKRLNLSAIRIDGGTQLRKALNEDKVQEYADLMRDKVEFPNVTVFFDGSDYWLSSGFHRYFATKAIGSEAIDCDVREGTLRDAKLFSYGANKHGLPHTPEENRQIVLDMINDPEWGKWSGVQIAKHIGVSGMTISRIRKSLDEKPGEVTYINKHGQEATMKPSGKKASQEKPQKGKPDSHLNTVKVTDDDRVGELTNTIVSLDEENTRLKDIISAQKWDATEIEVDDIHDTVKQLREQIRVLEIDNKALRDSRDMYQQRNAELIRQVKSLSKK